MIVQRTGLALLTALVVATALYFTVHAFYGSGFLTVDVSDSEGHGPDDDSAEWRDAVQRAIPFRSSMAGALVGTISFFVAFRALRPRVKPPEPAGSQVDMPPGGLVFAFQPRWKEELVCSCPLGSFILEMPMGVVTVYLPTAGRWRGVAPAGAAAAWATVHRQLSHWCQSRQIPLLVDASAHVYPGP